MSNFKCRHVSVQTEPSPHAEVVGYKPFTKQQLFTAATGSRKKISSDYDDLLSIFPAPLVLPGDELSHDPKYPPQSFKSWLNLKERNQLTERRKIVYLAAYPGFSDDVPSMMRSSSVATQRLPPVQRPKIDDVLAYLQAFFHGLPVRLLPDQLEYTRLDVHRDCKAGQEARKKCSACDKPPRVGLRSKKSSVTTSVGVRHLGTENNHSSYEHQLNLNDILDHAIAVLPDDAYCLLFLVDQDMFEDENDDFCCGRAYGGSRIAVVSSAQYQPLLDRWHDIKMSDGHIWPGSHCKEFVNQVCQDMNHHETASKAKKQIVKKSDRSNQRGRSASDAVIIDSSVLEESDSMEQSSPLEVAIATHHGTMRRMDHTFDGADMISQYLRRVCLTISHELLHCFGLDHCVYSACAMQGTAGMDEDGRQPPYLCLVCENKLAKAISTISMWQARTGPANQDWWNLQEIRVWKEERARAVSLFCQGMGTDNLGFAGLAAWVDRRMNLGCG